MGLNPKYVLDEISTYEIKALFKYQHYRIKDNWEQTRFISLAYAQAFSKKKLKEKDIIEFSWENENNDNNKFIKPKNPNKPMTDEEYNKLKAKAQFILDNNLLT